jgi:hypothetical protein
LVSFDYFFSIFGRSDFIEGAKSFSPRPMRDFSYDALNFLQGNTNASCGAQLRSACCAT